MDEPTRRRASLPSRERRWGGLALAAVLIGAALVANRVENGGGGDDGRFGLVSQLPPAEAERAALATAPEVGKLAPNFRLETLDGQVVQLSDLRGRPVFLNFWATWCFSCVTEMPAMQKLADKYGEQVVVLGVNTGEPADRARVFAENMEIRYLLVLDSDMEVTTAYGVRAMPTSLFIDANGVVHSVSYGVLFPDQMEERLAPLLPPNSGHWPAPAKMAGASAPDKHSKVCLGLERKLNGLPVSSCGPSGLHLQTPEEF